MNCLTNRIDEFRPTPSNTNIDNERQIGKADGIDLQNSERVNTKIRVNREIRMLNDLPEVVENQQITVWTRTRR